MRCRVAMMGVRAVLVLFLAAASTGHEEMDFMCPTTNKLVASTLVCDGTIHCPNVSESRYDDEWSFCIPAPYLQNFSIVANEVTGTSVLFSWSGVIKRIPDHPLKLAGYFLTVRSKDQSFQDRVHRRRMSHRVEELKPSTLYAFIFRPYYTDDGVSKMPRKIGRATTVEVQTLSADHFLVFVEVVNSTAAVVTWRMSTPGKRILLQLYELKGDGNEKLHMLREYHGVETALSSYNVFIGNLDPWTRYMATVDDCSSEYCKLVGNRTFLTPPSHLPNATVTRIESRRPGSFEMEWAYPQDNRPYHGFRVRYCEELTVVCSLVFTKHTNLTVEGLANDTVYNVDVRAQFKIPDGRVVLGPPQTASVVTLSETPVLSIKHEANVNDRFGASVLSWTTPNSSVGYFEYRLDEKGPWTPCDESPDCNVTVEYEEREEPVILTSGFIAVRHYRISGKVNVGFRGCNTHGCGKEYRVEFTPRLEDPFPFDAGFEVRPRKYSALLRWKDTGVKGFEIEGRCGDEWRIHYEKSMHETSLHSDQNIEVKGLPLKAEECEFFFRTYEAHGNVTHYDKIPGYDPDD